MGVIKQMSDVMSIKTGVRCYEHRGMCPKYRDWCVILEA